MATKPTVLMIDDNPAVSEIISVLLTRNGYNVQSLSSGERVYEMLAQREIDVIVSDVRMPGLDGYELARKLRADPATADIPIVLLTGLTSMEDEFEGYLAGADAYMTKPFRARELLATIDQVLNRRSAPSGSGRSSGMYEVARVLAVVGEDRRRTVDAAMKQAGFELIVEAHLADALKRIDHERFNLFICDSAADSSVVSAVREFLSRFALATPVIILHPRNAPPVLPANDPQFRALRVPATSIDLAEMARKAVLDFSGPP